MALCCLRNFFPVFENVKNAKNCIFDLKKCDFLGTVTGLIGAVHKHELKNRTPIDFWHRIIDFDMENSITQKFLTETLVLVVF